MKKMPNLFGKSVYRGMSAFDAMTAAERLRTEMAAARGPGPITWQEKSLPRPEAARLAAPMSMKTVNRDFSFFTSWGSWMEKNGARKRLLHGGQCPFAGKAFTKKQVRNEARKAGRLRRLFTREELAAIVGAPLFREPFPMQPGQGATVTLQQARFWSIMIGLYAGMRLGEIALLRPADIREEDGIARIRLHTDASRSFKSEAGDRTIPLHPVLIRFGLPEFARRAAETGATRLLPGMRDKGGQHGASVSVWFTKFRREQGVDSQQTVFHSFRHCFVTGIRSKRGTDEVLVDQIVGHDEYSSSVRRIYTGDLPLEEKAKVVAAIDYKLDISHILAWIP